MQWLIVPKKQHGQLDQGNQKAEKVLILDQSQQEHLAKILRRNLARLLLKQKKKNVQLGGKHDLNKNIMQITTVICMINNFL